MELDLEGAVVQMMSLVELVCFPMSTEKVQDEDDNSVLDCTI
jgi:hypothetical protein